MKMNMENEKIKLKSVYNILRDLVTKEGGWMGKELPKMGINMEVLSNQFPESLKIGLEELQELLQRLEDLGVIKFDGIVNEKTNRPYGGEAYTVTTPILRIWFLKDADIEELIQKEVPQNGSIEFLDNEVRLKCGKKICQLPPYKNEHFFCRAVYTYQINEPIDWSAIYEKMAGEEPKNYEKNSRTVYDTMESINKRAKKTFGVENLFVWREKTITRTR